MKVKFVGKMDLDTLAKKLTEVTEHTQAKVMEDNHDVNITGNGIHEAEVTVKFDVDGVDEPQILTVEHHKGQTETFTWVVDLDNDKMSSNENESMFDDWTVAKAKGQEIEFKEIQSVYNAKDLTEIKDLTEQYGDMGKKVFEHKEGYRVAQVYQQGKLVQEIKLIPKEDQE